jgi:hypothetical protein
MGSYSELYIADYPILSTKSYVDPIVMTIFREMDKRVFERKTSEKNPLVWGYIEDKGEMEVAYEYRNSVPNVIQRLDVMGFSLNRARKDFEENLDSKIEELTFYIDEETFTSTEHYSYQKSLLENSTFDDWLQALEEIIIKKIKKSPGENYDWNKVSPLIQHIVENDNWGIFESFPYSDIRYFLRILLEVAPKDGLVAQDITELVHAGYYNEDDDVCEISINGLTQDYPVNEKIIILAEGSTDINILKKSLRLLYPHLSDYYSFMDFGLSNAQGSAGNLINTIKAFVGSGISNRIIAIFDNDSAGFDAIRGLNKTSIPSNIKILSYPDIEIARSYPTLGPSGVSHLDINILACSVNCILEEMC